MKAASWYWNYRKWRIRAGWRVLIQIILTTGIVYGLNFAGVFSSGHYLLARIETTLLAVTLSILWLCVRFLDKRNYTDLGTNIRETQWWVDLACGITLGIVQAIVFLSIALTLGWITIEPFFQSLSGSLPLPITTLIDLITILCVAIMEESIRAYQLRNIAEGVANSTGKWWLGLLLGAIVASLFSVIMHLNQQGPGFWVYVFVRGLIYSLAFSLTGRLAIAMGLHLTWDFLITTVVSLGGASGINAAVLFEAPLVEAGNAQLITGWMNQLGLLVQIVVVTLMILYIRTRNGKLKVLEKLTWYSPRKGRE